MIKKVFITHKNVPIRGESLFLVNYTEIDLLKWTLFPDFRYINNENSTYTACDVF